jgi:serine/threonine protein kinase
MVGAVISCPNCGAQLEANARFCGLCGTSLGRVIGGRYVLGEQVGTGSLGVVYRAERMGLGRKVAIKLLAADPKNDPRMVERFKREGALLCQLKSPHTVTIYEFDHDADGSLYIAMELAAGRSLATMLREDGPLHWTRVLRILKDLCDALGEAHALGVIHRDLKPENILIEVRPNHRDFAKLLDFGLAKLVHDTAQLSAPGQQIGAIEFSSPEQLLRGQIDGRSDVYGLGVLGFLLATGRHPFHDAKGFGGMVAAHVERMPPLASSVRPDVPADLDVILARCLVKDPAARYPSVAALAAIIDLALAAVPPEPDTIRELQTGEEDTMYGEPPDKSGR